MMTIISLTCVYVLIASCLWRGFQAGIAQSPKLLSELNLPEAVIPWACALWVVWFAVEVAIHTLRVGILLLASCVVLGFGVVGFIKDIYHGLKS